MYILIVYKLERKASVLKLKFGLQLAYHEICKANRVDTCLTMVSTESMQCYKFAIILQGDGWNSDHSAKFCPQLLPF